MNDVHNPGLLANAIDLDLERFRRLSRVHAMPEMVADTAQALARVSALLREAEARCQSVDVSDEIVRLIVAFRAALRAAGGAPAQA
jgi:type VI protein secretion system component VasF